MFNMTSNKSQAEYVKEAAAFDPKKFLYNDGSRALALKADIPNRQARSFIGKCLKATKDDPYPVMEALNLSQDKAEPVAFMRQCLLQRGFVLAGKNKKLDITPSGDFQKRLMNYLEPATVASWFNDVQVRETPEQLIINTPKTFFRDWIAKNYMFELKEMAGSKEVIIR